VLPSTATAASTSSLKPWRSYLPVSVLRARSATSRLIFPVRRASIQRIAMLQLVFLPRCSYHNSIDSRSDNYRVRDCNSLKCAATWCHVCTRLLATSLHFGIYICRLSIRVTSIEYVKLIVSIIGHRYLTLHHHLVARTRSHPQAL
jgi:hypothetical protein